MPSRRSRIFVGSSNEARDAAEEVTFIMSASANVFPWWLAEEFGALAGTLEGLLLAATNYDYAVFLLTPDDVIESRGEKFRSTRDNVLFEAGLFLGALGKDRIAILLRQDPSRANAVKLPSDLLGVTMPRFAGVEAELRATLNSALTDLRNRMRKYGSRPVGKLAESWGFDAQEQRFSMTLSGALLSQASRKLADCRFILVARIKDEDKDWQDDQAIAVSELRQLPYPGESLRIRTSPLPDPGAGEGSVVEGHLFLTDNSSDLVTPQHIKELLMAGAELVESKAVKVR